MRLVETPEIASLPALLRFTRHGLENLLLLVVLQTQQKHLLVVVLRLLVSNRRFLLQVARLVLSFAFGLQWKSIEVVVLEKLGEGLVSDHSLVLFAFF